MLDTTYVAADTISGVYKIDPIDYPELGLMSIDSFVSSLSTLDDDEVIFTVFGPESEGLYNDLDEEYGIH